MSWNLTGNYVETCSCELMCPCNLSLDHGATYDYCRVTLAFDVNWRVGVFIDDQATDAQFDKLVQVFSGQLGGPMAGLAPLIGEMLGVERASIDVDEDGLRHRVRVGSAIEFDVEDIVPFGVETG